MSCLVDERGVPRSPAPITMRSDLKAPSSWEWAWTMLRTLRVQSSPIVVRVFSTIAQPSSKTRRPIRTPKRRQASDLNGVPSSTSGCWADLPVPLVRPELPVVDRAVARLEGARRAWRARSASAKWPTRTAMPERRRRARRRSAVRSPDARAAVGQEEQLGTSRHKAGAGAAPMVTRLCRFFAAQPSARARLARVLTRCSKRASRAHRSRDLEGGAPSRPVPAAARRSGRSTITLVASRQSSPDTRCGG